MTSRVKLHTDPSLCTACRACELACHFRHTGKFGTSQNSIHIDYLADSGDVIIAIDHTCDLCGGHPFCVEFCKTGALFVIKPTKKKANE